MEHSNFVNTCGIITGAASGIGQGAAVHFAAQGARLALIDISPQGLDETADKIRKAGGEPPLVFDCDVSDAAKVKTCFRTAAEHFGTIDFAVNSAGILRGTSFQDIEDDEWDLMIAVNLRGIFLCCREVVRTMLKKGKGAIVNVSSLAGRTCSKLGGAHYTSAKHAVVGLSRHMAQELAPKGIRVNAFCPGGTLTPMIHSKIDQEQIESIAGIIPMRRWSTPEEQAKAIAFLVSEDSGFITGACLDSNGGMVMI